jgi:hypothetical protein
MNRFYESDDYGYDYDRYDDYDFDDGPRYDNEFNSRVRTVEIPLVIKAEFRISDYQQFHNLDEVREALNPGDTFYICDPRHGSREAAMRPCRYIGVADANAFIALEGGRNVTGNRGLEFVLEGVHKHHRHKQVLVYTGGYSNNYIHHYYGEDMFVHGGPRTIFTDAERSGQYYDLCRKFI